MFSNSLSAFNKIILLFSIFAFVEFVVSCGLKTPPKNIKEEKQKSSIKSFNVIQKGNHTRISWEISEIERINALKKFFVNHYDNESERSKVFGIKNVYYEKLKKRLPEFSIDQICKWYEENFENLFDRKDNLKEWFNSQFKNGKEKENAFSKLGNNQNLIDYFLIKEKIKPFDCNDCEAKLKEIKKLNFLSNKIFREGQRFYYYLDTPKNDLFLRDYELSHHGIENELLSPLEKFKFKKANLFPIVPDPKYKIIQFKDAKQTLQFAFGKVIIKEPLHKEEIKNKKRNLSLLKIKKSDNETDHGIKALIVRISWPEVFKFGTKKLTGKGNFFEGGNNFKVNLYRRKIGENWAENPINSKSNDKNYFLDKIKLKLYSSANKNILDLQSISSPSSKIPFYIDLQGGNSDTLLYQIRLVDRFGNESKASRTITLNLPRKIFSGKFNAEKNNFP